MIKLRNILKEIGEGTGKPFSWKPKENIQNWLDIDVLQKVSKIQPGSMTRVIDVGNFEYNFTSDITDAKYFVIIEAWAGRTPKPFPKLGGKIPKVTKPQRPRADYFIECSVSFGVTSNEELESTNLNEQYRVMSTVSECIFNFIKSVEDYGPIQVNEVNIYPKADDPKKISAIDSRRGRIYLAYIKKMINKLPTKRKFYVVPVRDDGFSIRAGEPITGPDSKVLATN